jgi:hypothetical protein
MRCGFAERMRLALSAELEKLLKFIREPFREGQRL